MNRDPKRLEHPRSVYYISLFVWLIILFVLAGVVNHLAFSSHGPGLLRPLVERFQKKESPAVIKLREHRAAEEHSRFHHIVETPQAPDADRSTCYICHSNLPHTKTKKIRAMLNMHSNYLVCESCHLNITAGETVVYKWYSPVEKNPEGPFFGTSYDPETGELEMVNDQFSKIAPFYVKDGTPVSTAHTHNAQEAQAARDFVKIRNKLTPDEQKEQTRKFHVDIRPKGPECQTCHATRGILDFKALGFSQKRAVDIENLSIKGMITKYDEFYLPDLFKQSESSESPDQDGQ